MSELVPDEYTVLLSDIKHRIRKAQCEALK